MTWRSQASSVSKSGLHPTQLSITADGHSQPHHGHMTTMDQIPHSYPRTHAPRSTSVPANVIPPGSPPYRHTTRTMTNRHKTSTMTTTAKLITITMMASNSQSTESCGNVQCRVCGADQRAKIG